MQATLTASLDPGLPIGGQLLALLRGRVIRGDLAPGQKLSEAGLAAELGISRQPVREAFIRLAEEGLLEIWPQRGTVVPRISVKGVQDARFVREAIEADVIRLAAEGLPEAALDVLDGLIAAQRKAREIDAFMMLDDQFHRALAEAVGRGFAWSVVAGLKAQLDRVRYLTIRQFPRDSIIADHARIVKALRRRDAKKADRAIRRHLKNVTTDMRAIAMAFPNHFRD